MALPANQEERKVLWEGSSKKDLQGFPQEVQETVVFALEQACQGLRHPDVRTLRGFGGASVLEVIEDHAGDTYRAVYTVRYADAIWVIHCFQKKSKGGIQPPPRDMNVIKARLKSIEKRYREKR